MHSLRFLHHDLFPRNVLVTGMSDVFFLDCWAGGLPPQLRSPAYDMACLTLNTEGEWSAEELEFLVETYLMKMDLDRDRFLRSLERERRALVTAPR
jgi:aminoglycoside/choline kinase family phosphotransferase